MIYSMSSPIERPCCILTVFRIIFTKYKWSFYLTNEFYIAGVDVGTDLMRTFKSLSESF